MRSPRPPWDFDYAPVIRYGEGAPSEPCDAVIATAQAVDATMLRQMLDDLLPQASVEALVTRPPIFWTRLRSVHPADHTALAERLRARGVSVRYVAPASRGSLVAPAPLDLTGAAPARPTSWRARRAEPVASDTPSEGRWFLGPLGVAVDRDCCGTGAGTRLAVLDDDAAEVEWLDLDALVPVGLAAIPHAQPHGPLMVAWAVGARSPQSRGPTFVGVAPHASPRLYCMPKPGSEVVSLPLAIVRAVFDGADVIQCATYVEGTMSPMLDDALEVAARLGRGGWGTPVVLPTGREASSSPRSIHASLSLGLGDPASDPRVFCIAPSSREGGWFVWRDRRGRLRPFANRGPAVRWMAPGDDLVYPFDARERPFHAESSGASAIAAGVLLLVLSTNPTLRVRELHSIVTATATEVAPTIDPSGPLGDPSDFLPTARDPDGHSAKHGYGRINAARACLAATDPICTALFRLGEDDAAARFSRARRRDRAVRSAYSRPCARWAARVVACDDNAAHALCALLRHLRLVSREAEREEAHGSGALARELAAILRTLGWGSSVRPRARVRAELEGTIAQLAAPGLEPALIALAKRVFGPDTVEPRVPNLSLLGYVSSEA